MKALFSGKTAVTNYERLDADIFTGTSVGSFNAAFMVSQPGRHSADTANDLEKIWLNDVAENPRMGNGVFRFRGNPEALFPNRTFLMNPIPPVRRALQDSAYLAQDFFKRFAEFLQSSASLSDRALAMFDLCTFVSVEPLKELIKKNVSLEGIRRSDKTLRVIMTNWEMGQACIFGNEDMTDIDGISAVMASAAIPGFFPPVSLRDQPCVDGGIVMNTPLTPALRAGADVIHMIYLDPDPCNIPLDRIQNMMSTMDRMLTIQSAITINEDIETVNWVNKGLEVVERAAQGEIPSDEDTKDFIRVAAQIHQRLKGGSRYQKVTVHRYHPRQDLGGVLGLLNFGRTRMAQMIELGFNLACQYDPAKESVLPVEAMVDFVRERSLTRGAAR